MKRWDVTDMAYRRNVGLIRHDHGRYVLYSDVAPLVESVKAYKSECDNPVMDPVLKRYRRDQMLAALSTLDADGSKS